MKNFINSDDIKDYSKIIKEAIRIKKEPLMFNNIGSNKSIGLIFFNSSLRTRLSTQKAAMMLGLRSFIMNFNSEGWQIEFEDNAVMSMGKAEHVKEAAGVISKYLSLIHI